MPQIKRLLLVLAIVLFNSLTIDIVFASTVTIPITVEGDAIYWSHKDPFNGYTSGLNSNADPNVASYLKQSGVYDFNLTYMEFSLAPLDGQEVTSATLYLYITSAWSNRDDNKAALLRHVSSAGDATGIAANDQLYGNQSQDGWTIYGDQTNGWIGFDVKNRLVDDLNLDYNWSAWTMIFIDSLSDLEAGIEFSSGDNSAGHAPYLSVITSSVPIPSALWLLGSGLIGIVGFRKKLRKA